MTDGFPVGMGLFALDEMDAYLARLAATERGLRRQQDDLSLRRKTELAKLRPDESLLRGAKNMVLVKHSVRTARRACDGCGSTDYYWAHDSSEPNDAGECGACGGWGSYVMVNSAGLENTPAGAHVYREHLHCCLAPEAPQSQAQVEKREAPKTDPWGDPPEGSENDSDAENSTGDESQGGDGESSESDSDSEGDSGSQLPSLEEIVRIIARQEDEPLTEALKSTAAMSVSNFGKVRDELTSLRTAVEQAAKTGGEELTRVEVLAPDMEAAKRIEGAQHKTLPCVLTDVGAGEHVLMVGPAGTGKSTIAEQVAEGLGLEFYAISLSPQTPASALLGYMQAVGEYVRTAYRNAFEHGGVFHFDEFDNAHPSVLAVINSGLANRVMAFPDGMVKRHENFRVLASANTFGRGPDRMYVGRQQVDAATMDRFTVEFIDVDNALEMNLCMATGAERHVVCEVLRYVRKVRARAEKHKMPVVVSPRASIGMCKLLRAGRSIEAAIEARVRRGLSDGDWQKLTDGVSSPELDGGKPDRPVPSWA